MIDDNVQPVKFAKELYGVFETVSTVPTAVPKNFLQQIKFYKSGTTYRIYIYDCVNNVWRYAALT